jgi:hypothetical protein
MRVLPPHPARSVALWTLVAVTLLAIWIRRPTTSQQEPSVEQLKSELDLARDYITAQERREWIRDEIARLDHHEWAGEYVADNYAHCGLASERESILVAPSGGFVWTYHVSGNRPAARFAYGDVVAVDDDAIHVQIESDRGIDARRDERWAKLTFPSKLIRAKGDGRRYLVPVNRIVELCNDYNWGCARMRYFLPVLGGGSSPDERERVDVVPTLAAPYDRWILARPIRARVVQVGEPRVVWTSSTFGPVECWHECDALIDAGDAEGLVEGMDLTPCGKCMPCSITEVFDHSARIKFGFYGKPQDRPLDHAETPQVGVELSPRSCD